MQKGRKLSDLDDSFPFVDNKAFLESSIRLFRGKRLTSKC